MKDILQLQFLGNTVQVYIEVFGAILVALVIKRIISRYLAALLFRLFERAGKTFHRQAFMDLVVAPLETFILLFIVVISLDKLHLPDFLNVTIYRVSAREVLESIANIILIIAFTRLCLRFIRYFAFILQERNIETTQSHTQLIVFFRDFFKVIVYVVAILLILRFAFSYDISKLITGLSIVGAAIALATKESLENLIASFIIFFDKPFVTGDVVKVQGFTGTVEKIGLRSTRIRTDQKTYITVPNKQMVDTILDNLSMRTQRRADLRLELGLTASAEELKEVVREIKTILRKGHVTASTVLLSEITKTSHVITVEYYTDMNQTLEEFNTLKETINLEIVALLSRSAS